MLFNSVVVNLIQYSHNYVTSHLHCIFTLIVLRFYKLMKLIERPIRGQFALHAIITTH